MRKLTALFAFILLVSLPNVSSAQSHDIRVCDTSACAEAGKVIIKTLQNLAAHVDTSETDFSGNISVVAPTSELPGETPVGFQRKGDNYYIVVSLNFFHYPTTEATLALTLGHELCHILEESSDHHEGQMVADKCALELLDRAGYAPEPDKVSSFFEAADKKLNEALLKASEISGKSPGDIMRLRAKNQERWEWLSTRLDSLQGRQFILFQKQDWKNLKEHLPESVP